MNAKIKILAEEASKLTADERAELVDWIVETIHQTDPDIEQAWLDEVERRQREMESGLSKPIPIEDIPLLANLRRSSV